MRIRPVEPADLPACLDLFSRVAEEGRWIATEAPIDRPEIQLRWEALLRGRDGTLLLAEESAGFPPSGLAALVGRSRPELGMLVAPGERRRGIGSALLVACAEWARAAGAIELFLQVFPHNAPALALYRRHGFVEQERIPEACARRNGERWDTIRMVKTL